MYSAGREFKVHQENYKVGRYSFTNSAKKKIELASTGENWGFAYALIALHISAFVFTLQITSSSFYFRNSKLLAFEIL